MNNFDYRLCFNLLVIISAVALVFLLTVSFYYLVFWTISGRKPKKVPHSDNLSKFAILIAARNESKVIGNLLDSLKKQTYPKEYFDVWVIVEDITDPTVKICEQFGYHYFIRDELTDNRKTKGFALQECIRHFKSVGLEYDAYMIFDADNVMENNYIEVMNDLRQTGVQVGLGTRAFTNADKNWLTAGSSIMFAYMNNITSSARTILFHKATLMGTGYFIDSDLIEEAGGWIFTGMTEDIQLTAYCYYRDVYMKYYPVVKFYDEQSATYKTVHMQHLRWLKGYFSKRIDLKTSGISKEYHTKEMQGFMNFEFKLGVFPFVAFLVVSFILLVLFLVFGSFAVFYSEPKLMAGYFIMAGWNFFIPWLCFAVAAIMVIYRHNDELRLSKKHIFSAVLTYMFFFYDFGLAFIDMYIHPNKGKVWKTVEHTGEMTNKDAKKVK